MIANSTSLPSGEPITRDITGEEFYSTLYAITESPHEAGVIWVGANDGPFHITRDNGKTWTNITPKDLELGGRVIAEGVAEDETIEAIRIEGAMGFALGVQWHAEYDPSPNAVNRALFEAFGKAVRDRAAGGLHGRQAAE